MFFFFLLRGAIIIEGRLVSEEKRKVVVCCWVGLTEVVGMLLGGKGRLVAGGADEISKALVDLLNKGDWGL